MMERKKAIFITGAASGIGRATALLFGEKGWFVGIFDVNEKGLESLQYEIGETNCFSKFMDVTDTKSVQTALTAFTKMTEGQLDVIFNNAGVIKFGHFENVPILENHQVIDVNLKGVLNCIYYSLDYLKNTPGAKIINMASASAIYGIPDLAVYSSTKHAVCAMTEALDIELEKYGITVCDILAPYVNTPLLDVPQNVYSLKKMGINIEPTQVAETVWKAANRKKLHWKIGGPTYVLIALYWLVPFIRRSIAKFLTIPPNEK
jgi:NADP-dependent 3-hydroxy acid dehydrogenase YdfG